MSTLPAIQSAAEITADEGTLLVAFASMDGDIVDQHFGSAQAFFLFKVTAEDCELVASHEFGSALRDGNEDKLKPRLAWLAGSDVVYCASIGGSATKQLIALGVNPIQVNGGPDVEELLGNLKDQLKGTPEAWLANILRRKTRSTSESRFSEMSESGWDE